MNETSLYTEPGASLEEISLYIAAEKNNEAAVKIILASPAAAQAQLNLIEIPHGWTPLFTACFNGFTPIVKLLLEAGADMHLVDYHGWTAKEYAVFTGHLDAARVFAAYQDVSARLQPLLRYQLTYKRSSRTNQIFVYLGPSHTRNNLAPIELDSPVDTINSAGEKLDYCIKIESHGTNDDHAARYRLASLATSTANKPQKFDADHLEKVSLEFSLLRLAGFKIEVVGTGAVLVRTLRQGLAPERDSLIRHLTVPIFQPDSMACIGAITFSILIITPFRPKVPPPPTSLGFWKDDGSCPVIGHRGSGAANARTVVQIGESSAQSILTAIDKGACCVHFDVQLTKDHHPVIYHDFHVKETGGDIPVHALTLAQFEHLSRSQTPKGDRVLSRAQRYLESIYRGSDPAQKPRSYSINDDEHSRYLELLDRLQRTDQGLYGNLESKVRKSAIQEPLSTLKQLLTEIPESIPYHLGIKYPTLWEAEDRSMEFHAIEVNLYVDTILTMLFEYGGERNITLSSLSPDICIALACKQEIFPILMVNKAGAVPASDIRAGSLKGAFEFAKAWRLDGIVSISDPLVMCPRLLSLAKDMGLVVVSYGAHNNDAASVLVSGQPGGQELQKEIQGPS